MRCCSWNGSTSDCEQRSHRHHFTVLLLQTGDGGGTAGEEGNFFNAPVMHLFCVGKKVCCVIKGYKMTSIGNPFSDYMRSTHIKELFSLRSEILNKKNKNKT